MTHLTDDDIVEFVRTASDKIKGLEHLADYLQILAEATYSIIEDLGLSVSKDRIRQFVETSSSAENAKRKS